MLNPTHLLNVFGTLGIFAILFAETGLLIGIVLPGDSLLFTAGLLSSIHRHGDVHLNLLAVMGAALLGAILGAQTGYILGRKVGPRLFNRPDSRFFKQQYVVRTHEYLEKYGPARAIMLARFVPVVRTLMNPLAGAVDMDSGVFTAANFVGGVLWAIGVTLAGYLLGKSIHNVDHYILPIVAVIVVASLIPVALEVRKSRRERAAAGQPRQPEPEPATDPADV